MNRRVQRAEIIDQQFIDHVRQGGRPHPAALNRSSVLSDQDLLALFDSQLVSRQLDLMARVKRQEEKVFYTIGSSGHEGNAMVARLSRPTDPAFLHYRSGAFMAERYRQLEGLDFIADTARSFAAAQTDPASGGRHKVWGHRKLWVLPQTSTIGSHCPKALGTALAITSATRGDHTLPIPQDSVVICSLGDASLNHAVVQTTLNAAAWTRHQNLELPLVLVCEDNGWGISVPTPTGWVEASVAHRYGLTYFQANGLDLSEGYAVVRQAIECARTQRKPVFLHLKTVRLMGHAGTDFEVDYRSEQELIASERLDPILRSADLVLGRGLMSAPTILERYEALRVECLAAADEADKEPKLGHAETVMAPLAPFNQEAVQAEAGRLDGWAEQRMASWGDALPESSGPKHMAIAINQCLNDLLIKYPQAIVFGEDVAKKGGVYTVTKGLWARFGRRRVFNTLLDETTILGLAQGYANLGYLPIPEIQYLAYFHNACDQIRGEACSLQFFSNQQFANPMVMRIAGLGYQKGFGGHFHNDNSLTALRDIPGLVIGCPSRGDDAVMMLRTLMALAAVDGRVSAFIEPIALYMTKDLYAPHDRGWCFEYPAPDQALMPFEPRLYDQADAALLIVTYGNGVPMALRVAQTLEPARVAVMDLRWLKPLPKEQFMAAARRIGRVLIADEGRPDGGVGESLMAQLMSLGGIEAQLVTSCDSYIPLGSAAQTVMLSEQMMFDTARSMLGR